MLYLNVFNFTLMSALMNMFVAIFNSNLVKNGIIVYCSSLHSPFLYSQRARACVTFSTFTSVTVLSTCYILMSETECGNFIFMTSRIISRNVPWKEGELCMNSVFIASFKCIRLCEN